MHWDDWVIPILIVVVVVIFGVALYFGITNHNTAVQYERGVVVSKDYRPAWTQMVPIVHSNGKTTYTTYMTVYHPESWSAILRGVGGENEEFSVDIAERDYSSWNVGDTVRNPEYELSEGW